MKLFNAFSLNMVSGAGILRYKEISPSQAAELLRPGFDSFVGHPDTARVLTNILGVDVAFHRATSTLKGGDRCVVAQYKGPRLPEGATVLPEGAKITFFDCEIEE